MKLKSLTLKNFRAYQNETTIEFGELTALIGRNDVGKTTILDALGIFFGHKLCKYDISDKCVYAKEEDDVEITCVFESLPKKITIDTTSVTTLEKEFLVDENGNLELTKSFNKGKGTGGYYANCVHPSVKNAKGIILKKHDELKAIAETLRIVADDKRSSTSLRECIYQSIDDLKLKKQRIGLNKEDGKAILEKIQENLPHFALFRADRPSTDDEAEVQDPMKAAVTQALEEITPKLEEIKEAVRLRALGVARNTIRHLEDLDPELAMSLSPDFKADPKWDGIFKLSLIGEDGIAINKRGSGVRRLVLISFFKAEAERIKSAYGDRGVIYAIEEPETSQHPDKQRLLVDAFTEMADKEGCQIVLTTHVPALAEQLPTSTLRHIFKNTNGDIEIKPGSTSVLQAIAKDLGVLPDSRAKVIVCVEGPNDIYFLRNITKALAIDNIAVPDFENDPRIVLIPLGGDTLKEWVNGHYLKNIGKPEVHIYDRDTETPPKYQAACNDVNARGDNSIGFLTSKREMENYLHPDAILAGLGVSITYTDTCDVPTITGQALGIKERKAKSKLNKIAAKYMTKSLLDQQDPAGELLSWLNEITNRC